MQTKIVRYANRTRYWQVYAFSHPPTGYHYKKGLLFPSHHLRISKDYIRNSKIFYPFEKADLYHTYNGIVFNRKPWVAEVEDNFPRYGKHLDNQSPIWRFGFEKINSMWCKKLIYTSEYSRDFFGKKLIDQGLDPNKIEVVYRAVAQHDKVERKDGILKILFVSTTFFGKGGAELLKAFASLPYRDIKLTIVSNFSVDWGVYPTKEEETWARKCIEKDPRITHYNYLTHDQVIEQMRNSDLFVAVSYADTFNNTVLEAMGCGLTALTSEIRAFPEIIENGKNGYIIPTQNYIKDSITEAISEKLKYFYDNNISLQEMGVHSKEIVKRKFSIEKRNEQLKRIYDEILN